MAKKCMVSMQKSIETYQAVLFDVDGTLYLQRGLRAAMAKSLAVHFLLHPLRIKELFALFYYRRLRERWQTLTDSASCVNMEEAQYQYTAPKLHMSAKQVEHVITFWMHRYPLQLLPRYRDNELCALLRQLRELGIVTAAYSDYPAREKLKALGVSADFVFCSLDNDINCMKPDVRAMRKILAKLTLSEHEVLMIGDRYAKDGLAAKEIGMDYLILDTSAAKRHSLYQKWENILKGNDVSDSL